MVKQTSLSKCTEGAAEDFPILLMRTLLVFRGFSIVTRQLVALTTVPNTAGSPNSFRGDYDQISALNRIDSIHRGNVLRDFDSWLTLIVILQAALYALEDGGMSVDRVEHKHFMEALSTVKPSLTTAQLEQFKLMQR